MSPKYFNSTQEMLNYVSNENYNLNNNPSYPPLCFGFSIMQVSQTEFNYTLNYFDNRSIQKNGISNIPNGNSLSWDIFSTMPDRESFNQWQSSGYIYMMKIINDLFYQTASANSNNQIDFIVLPEKFSLIKTDPFANFIGFLLPFFIVIAYLSPLIIVVFRMVREKETKVKEGMKIMGLSETSYFMSWAIYYLCLNTFYAVFNAAILMGVFKYVGYGYIFVLFWLYGFTVFGMAFFFQAIIDKTRIAMIISILVYFIMYFVSVAVLSEDVGTAPKMVISLLPPTCLQLGISTLSRFEINFLKFGPGSINLQYQNFSVANFYTMLCIDIAAYLFLGYYLQNIVSHQFGVRKPIYFLCTKSYWSCGKKSSSNSKKISHLNDNINNNKNYNNKEAFQSSDRNGDEVNLIMENKDRFQDEANYQEKIKRGDFFLVSNLVKNFGGIKNVVDGVSLNFYKDEIFALLGHNGAGKTTIINILTGIYEKTSGEAQYKGFNIFDNMDFYRTMVGICPQQDVLFEQLSVREHLKLFSIFKGKTTNIEEDINKTINDLELNDKANELAKNLSGGQKRKLSIGIALIGGSEIVFLDEPSSGMDITSRRKLWDILKRCTQNRIIILTTHYMEEAAVLGKRIGILSSGKMKCLGTPLFLIDKFGKYLSVNVIKSQVNNNQDKEIIKFFESRIDNLKYEIFNEEILFRIPKNSSLNKKAFFAELDDNLGKLGIKTYGASMPTLEDVFLNLSAETKALSNDNSREIIINPSSEHKNSKGFYDYDPTLDHEKSSFKKFFIDIKAVLYKRWFQVVRDSKSFLLEFLCPIVLVVIGCGVSSVKFQRNSDPKLMSFSRLPNPQYAFVNPYPFASSNNQNLNLQNYLTTANSTAYNFNFTTGFTNPSTSYSDALNRYQEYITGQKSINDTSSNNYLGAYYFLKVDSGINGNSINNNNNNQYTKYELAIYSNPKSIDATIIYIQEILTNLISKSLNKQVSIKVNKS